MSIKNLATSKNIKAVKPIDKLFKHLLETSTITYDKSIDKLKKPMVEKENWN